MGPGSLGWGLGLGLTTPACKKLPVRIPEMWPETLDLEIHYGGKVTMKKKVNKRAR